EMAKLRGHHADDRVAPSVEPERPPYDGGVPPKCPGPVRVAEHEHRWVGCVLLRERACNLRTHSQQLRKTRREPSDSHRLVDPRVQRDPPSKPDGFYPFEDVRELPQHGYPGRADARVHPFSGDSRD